MTPVLVIAGGFLGAGKTTLLLKAAAILRQRGLRVAMITNDQGTELVDTRMAAVEGVRAAEISGGCFCCRFTEVLLAAERLLEFGPDVIFAEPVGSCIDLASMMRRLCGGRFRVAPLTVLVDPERARELLAPGADPDLVYLFRNQVAEAEILCSTRADVNGEAEGVEVRYRLSGRTGEGVEEWLAEVLSAEHEGGRALSIDYGRYAEAEAALGWLNWQARLELREATTPAAVVGPLLERLDSGLTQAGAVIAHLKIFNRTETGYIKAAICRNGAEPDVDGDLAASASRRHEVVLNLRAVAAPELLRDLVDQAAAELPGTLKLIHCEAFRPAPPVRQPIER